MKFLLYVFITFFTLSTFAETNYNVKEGRWHEGRDSKFSIVSKVNGDTVGIKLNYDLECKGFSCLYKKILKGTHYQEIPKSLIDEYGYIKLENDGKMNFGKVEIIHQGRVDIGRYLNAHKILIQKIKKKDRTYNIVAYYHPEVRDAGWAKIIFTKTRPIDYVISTIVKK